MKGFLVASLASKPMRARGSCSRGPRPTHSSLRHPYRRTYSILRQGVPELPRSRRLHARSRGCRPFESGRSERLRRVERRSWIDYRSVLFGGSRLLTKIVSGALSILVPVVVFIVAALLAFVPLTALPGELQTGFVNAAWVKVAGVTLVAIVMGLRLRPSAHAEEESSWRGIWTFISTFVGIFWVGGGLIWINAYSVEGSRTHDMVVTGYQTIARSPGGTPIAHYKLSEIGTSWKADLEPTEARDRFVRHGACVRIVVRKGRLGLDWISDAFPIQCPEPHDVS